MEAFLAFITIDYIAVAFLSLLAVFYSIRRALNEPHNNPDNNNDGDDDNDGGNMPPDYPPIDDGPVQTEKIEKEELELVEI